MATQLTTQSKLYIGMDVHKKNWSVNMRTDLCEHKSMTIPANEEVLYNYVNSNFSDHEVSLVYEAGCCGFGSARYFLELGWEVLVVNPADVPVSEKQYYQKTDKIDCRNLSKQLQAGQLKGIYIPDVEQDLLKSLLRQKASAAKGLRNYKNQIKSLLLYHGIKIPDQFDNANWSKAFITWIRNLKWTFATGKQCMESKLRMYELYRKEGLGLANELRAYCRKHYKKDYYLLVSIPGIGGYTASAVLAEVGDLRRFTETEFASYVGIIPMMRNSGASENQSGVTPRCKALLRSYIIESAWQAYRFDPEMQRYYRTHLGKDPNSIIIKIARKLLNRMLSVIKNETPYKINYALQKDETDEIKK